MTLNNSIVWLKPIVCGAYWTIPNKHYDNDFMRTFFFLLTKSEMQTWFFFFKCLLWLNSSGFDVVIRLNDCYAGFSKKLNIDLFTELAVAKTETPQLFVSVSFKYIFCEQIHQKKIKGSLGDWRCSSEVEQLPSMHQT